MGDFDTAKQQDVIYDLRGMHFTGSTKEQTDDHTYPIAGLLSAEAANWRDIGTQAQTLADDLEAGLNRLTTRWTGKAADEFATNVGKVVAFARAIAHSADTTRTRPPSGAATASDPFTAPASQSGQRQVLEALENSVITYTSTDKVRDPIWERDRWWWKWYDTWHYNFEVRAGEGDGSVVHGDINGGGFEDFMQQHGIETKGVSDGPLVSHPLPKDWENQVRAFEAKQYNDDDNCDDLPTAREAGNNLAKDFTEQQDKFPTAPQPTQFALTNPAGVDVPGGGGVPSGGSSPSLPTGSPGPSGSPNVPAVSTDGPGSSGHPHIPDDPDPTDTDHDGIPDVSDPHPHDQDNDGIPDSTDHYPNDPTNGGSSPGSPAGSDSDGDGIPDANDAFPNDPANSGGVGSGWSGGADSDGDEIPDYNDTYSHDPTGGGIPAGSGSWYGPGAAGTSNSDSPLSPAAAGIWSDGLDTAGGSARTGDWPDDGTDVDTGSELARAGGGASGLSAGSGSIGPAGAEAAGVSAGVGGAGAGGYASSVHALGGANAAGANRGIAGGMLPPMMGAGLGAGDNPAETTTWLSEDEDIWGTREGDLAPPVLGGSV